MKTLAFLVILGILSLIHIQYAQAAKFLVIPSTTSIIERKTVERLGKLFQSSGNQANVLLHNLDLINWDEAAIKTLPYGNADELATLLKNAPSKANQEAILLDHIDRDNLISRLKRENYDALVCNPQDFLCRYLEHNLNIETKIFLIHTCPKYWSDYFHELPKNDLLTKVKRTFYNFFGKFFFSKNQYSVIKYQSDALYLTECFTPLFNPQPNFENIYPVGSLLGHQSKKGLPDIYQKPAMLANKIVLVNLGVDEAENEGVLIETMKLFPTYLFIVVSKTFNIGEYAVGNVIAEEKVPINDILNHNKITMYISNGEWTGLLAASYHNVPIITLGSSKENALGRQFVKEKNIGVDLSGKKVQGEALETAIRNVVFDYTYKNNQKVISNYLKGLNNDYFLPNLVFNFFSAKPQKQTDL